LPCSQKSLLATDNFLKKEVNEQADLPEEIVTVPIKQHENNKLRSSKI
jgi:hypothetical protein